jgi:hypothetical protein
MATGRREFGAIRKLPSKRYQVSCLGPDLCRYVGPTTFQARIDAKGWVAQERRLIETERWEPPKMLHGLPESRYKPSRRADINEWYERHSRPGLRVRPRRRS